MRASPRERRSSSRPPAAGAAEPRKARGAFYTPPAIARFLADWAIAGDAGARVLDPTCGDGVFLLAAGVRLRALGASAPGLRRQLSGVDVDRTALAAAAAALRADGLAASFSHADLVDVPSPAELGDGIGWHDAVVGNPPFVRYQGIDPARRRRAAAAALAQGVALNGLSSSWAPLLVHATAFLKPEGRLAMVVPAELLTVSYAEPLRRWLRRRFREVRLVLFEELQFAEAEEHVLLLVAEGSGGCDSFTLYPVRGAADLLERHILDASSAVPRGDEKWSDLVLPARSRRLFRELADERFTRLDRYGTPELGTVTGANAFFALSEGTRRAYRLEPEHLKAISPPGTRHLAGLAFTHADWEALKHADRRVWLLHPAADARSPGLARYLAAGALARVPQAYKCTVRDPWWRPPAVARPDLFFTYMSHRYPRLIANRSRATILNSMHGVRLAPGTPAESQAALPLLALNSLTLLGAELLGRSYGGGVLKLEPREAAALPVPGFAELRAAFAELSGSHARLEAALAGGAWEAVCDEVDRALLGSALGLAPEAIAEIRAAAAFLRARRTRARRAEPG